MTNPTENVFSRICHFLKLFQKTLDLFVLSRLPNRMEQRYRIRKGVKENI